jgi:hypothetical protein
VKQLVYVVSLFALVIQFLPMDALAKDGNWKDKLQRDTWYWGMSLGATIAVLA